MQKLLKITHTLRYVIYTSIKAMHYKYLKNNRLIYGLITKKRTDFLMGYYFCNQSVVSTKRKKVVKRQKKLV